MSQFYLQDMGGPGPFVEILTRNSGRPVGPSLGNINIIGTGDIMVSGNAGTNPWTISATGLPVWNKIATRQTLSPNEGYICTGGGVLTLTLPPVSMVGDIIEITLDGSMGFMIAQTAGQTIRTGNQVTTAGVGGSVTSTAQGDSLRMVSSITDLRWNILSLMGNPTVV